MFRYRTSFVVLLFITVLWATAGQAIAAVQDADPSASPAAVLDTMVDIGGGRSLHVACVGVGSPTVLFETGGPILEGGTAAIAEVGSFVAPALGTRFCGYDRAGSGQSDADPVGVRSFEEAAADLNALLAAPELACPCVVIGESMGGSIALIALTADPAGFAGLVLLDPPYPGYWDEFIALAPPESAEASPELASYVGGENEEGIDMATGFGQVTTPGEPIYIPMIVVTHGAGNPPPCWPEAPCSDQFPVAEFEQGWQAGQVALAEALGARLVVAENTGHSIATENPMLVIELTNQVLAAVRDPGSWATPAA